MISFLHRKMIDRKPSIIAASLVVILVGLFIFFQFRPHTPDNSVIIVLSPHFDDAVISMGGLLAKHEHPTVVATFFTAEPAVATSTQWDTMSGFSNSKDAVTARTQENQKALTTLGVDAIKNFGYMDSQYRHGTSSDADLEQNMAQDIQALLASYGDKQISVYAPSIFGPKISHPDHALLHRAFFDVAENYPKQNVTFYFYEDYPYVEQFNKTSVISVEKNLENDTNRIFDTVQIPLTARQVSKKENSLSAYTSQIKAFDATQADLIKDDISFTQKRCGDTACEVVYKFFQVTP